MVRPSLAELPSFEKKGSPSSRMVRQEIGNRRSQNE
ncbi:hypothetical protein EKG36_01130 [Halomonas nitroreducens]|uniref:Uncharacterized protein n=1 Tax=Halomonas nitroreducens TaxID=447425 RepID=A0A431V985_9GAMM|nr:hypothetical protein EKG36_01130 [Halomonas nitroreducens]